MQRSFCHIQENEITHEKMKYYAEDKHTYIYVLKILNQLNDIDFILWFSSTF